MCVIKTFNSLYKCSGNFCVAAKDRFPITFDVRGLRPDMLRFPRFSVRIYVFIYSVTSQSKRKHHNANAGKT